MSDLKDITKPLDAEIEQFRNYFKSIVKSEVRLLNVVTAYVLKTKGKQLRPLLVLFSAAATGKISEKTYRAASLIEMLHTATLIHDDVVDESDKRRGFFSLNALWKNKAAVLFGDYLLSRGLLIALENKDHDMLEIASGAAKSMSEGELLQLENSRKINIEEAVYFDIIKFKTASLFSACCACGALSAGASPDIAKKMADFGENLGMAFQIKDDIFDYQQYNNTGKPFSNDIKEKKITLPLLYLLNNSSFIEKRKYYNIIRKKNKDPEMIKELFTKVYECGGIAYAENKLMSYCVKAEEILNHIQDSEYKESLKKIIRFSIERTK
ncbi:MAG: polyprenyl synthetase family protein [Bacteroidales bacterium]|nr:polyprenyl synthetase family protein [Bacteroidales bacterium]